MTREQVFTLEATPLKFGRGAAGDAGWELERLGVQRAMLVSDPGVVAAGDVVTVIVADFRGLDTLVEITVLLVAVIGVVALLRRGRLW